MGIDRHYAQTFIYTDVEREINLAKAGTGGGNLLAALGLLCYTEYVGGLMNNANFKQGEGRRNFNRGFRALGQTYRDFMDNIDKDVYGNFRCGLAHEYAPKGSCVVQMMKGTSTAGGIGRLPVPDGRFFINVEAYFDDFRAMCDRGFNDGSLVDRP